MKPQRDRWNVVIGVANLFWSSFVLPSYWQEQTFGLLIVASIGLLCAVFLLAIELPLSKSEPP